jgi:hypothetical protein
MEFGSYSVKVGIDGDAGSGSLLVPVPHCNRSEEDGPTLGLLLSGLPAAGSELMAIVGASVGQALCSRESRDASRRR